MPQTQLPRQASAPTRLKSAFWGRDSILTAILLQVSVALLTGSMFLSPLVRRLGDNETIGNTRVGAIVILMIVYVIPALASGWAVGRFVPRWSPVAWAMVNILYFWFRMLPELQAMWTHGDWQFWPMVFIMLTTFILQTWVVFATRRRVIHRLSTACG
jgi:hypothetical protein